MQGLASGFEELPQPISKARNKYSKSQRIMHWKKQRSNTVESTDDATGESANTVKNTGNTTSESASPESPWLSVLSLQPVSFKYLTGSVVDACLASTSSC